jgi:hypothetical protein
MTHDGDAGLHEVVDDVGMSADALDFNRVRSCPHELGRHFQGPTRALASRQEREIRHDQLPWRPSSNSPRVHRHKIDRCAERIAFAMDHHHRAVSDQQGVD